MIINAAGMLLSTKGKCPLITSISGWYGSGDIDVVQENYWSAQGIDYIWESLEIKDENDSYVDAGRLISDNPDVEVSYDGCGYGCLKFPNDVGVYTGKITYIPDLPMYDGCSIQFRIEIVAQSINL